jgi:predicted permease
MMGRLKPGVSRAQAEASLSALLSRMRQVQPNASGPSFELTDGSQGETGRVRDLRTPLKLLMATVALVLLIACINVASLLMARAAVRRRELAVRVAVGANRLRLIRQMLTESLLLSLLGGVFGAALAFWLSDLLAAYSPESLGGSTPPLLDGRLDWRVFAFTISLSLLTGLVFGLLPAWQSSKPDLTATLKEEAGAGGVGSARARMRSALVLAQIALALVVLVCAGLCARSLQNLQRIDAGFEAAKVLVVGLDVSLNGYTEEQGRQFYTTLLERVSALPDVEAASLADGVPLSGDRRGMSAIIEGYSSPNPKKPGVAFGANVVGPRYCATLKMALAAGREFTAQDHSGAPLVVIINEAAARAYWPNQNPVGKRLIFPGPTQRSAEIIGVVRDSRYRGLTEPVRPALLLPAAQNYSPSLSLHLRSAGAPAALVGAVRREVQALDPRLPLTRVRTLEEQRGAWLYSERITALLLAAFGGVALLLAGLGIYGVMAYAVTQRTREIGVRMALGAQAADVLRLVLRQCVWLIGGGMALGLAGALAATRLIKGFLYGVSATDPLTFMAVILLLAGVALLACYLPARRATKVDPLVALRSEQT